VGTVVVGLRVVGTFVVGSRVVGVVVVGWRVGARLVGVEVGETVAKQASIEVEATGEYVPVVKIMQIGRKQRLT